MNLKRMFCCIFFIFFNQSFILSRSYLTNSCLKKEAKIIIALLCKEFQMQNHVSVNFLPELDRHEASMSYCLESQTIAVCNDLKNKQPLSSIYVCLLHEFRHYMQDYHGMLSRDTGSKKMRSFYQELVLSEGYKQKNVLWFPKDGFLSFSSEYEVKNKEEKRYIEKLRRLILRNQCENIFKPTEFDADLFSLEQIHCPICYKISLYGTFPGYISPEGYLGLDFKKEFYKKNQMNTYCKAHSFNNDKDHNSIIEKLRSFIEKPDIDFNENQYRKEICQLDKQSGSLLDRHS